MTYNFQALADALTPIIPLLIFVTFGFSLAVAARNDTYSRSESWSYYLILTPAIPLIITVIVRIVISGWL